MSLHLKCRVFHRDKDRNIVSEPNGSVIKPMLLYGSTSYKACGGRKERMRFTHFSVHGEENGAAVYRSDFFAAWSHTTYED